MSYASHLKIQGGGLSYTAPGPRLATRALGPPPASNVTQTAPGSVYMSYGPGMDDTSQFMYNALPYGVFENKEPEATYDIKNDGGLGNAVVQGSAAGAGTVLPPSIDVNVTQPSQVPQLALIAIAAWLAYRQIVKSGPELVEIF